MKLKKIVKSHLTGRSLLGRELEYIFQTMSIGQIAGDQTYSQKMPRAARPRVGRAALPCVSRLDAGWGGGPIYAKR